VAAGQGGEGLESGVGGMKGGAACGVGLPWGHCLMVFTAIAGWQEMKYWDEETQTKALVYVRSPSADLSSPAEPHALLHSA